MNCNQNMMVSILMILEWGMNMIYLKDRMINWKEKCKLIIVLIWIRKEMLLLGMKCLMG